MSSCGPPWQFLRRWQLARSSLPWTGPASLRCQCSAGGTNAQETGSSSKKPDPSRELTRLGAVSAAIQNCPFCNMEAADGV
eukprot:366131-Chlamydomonas_euryale.AAC.23